MTLAMQASDFGPKTALKIVDQIRDEVKAGKLKTPAEIRSKLKNSIITVLQPNGKGSELQLGSKQTGVIFVVGVNGGGKTTTIGKLAHKFRQEDAKVRKLSTLHFTERLLTSCIQIFVQSHKSLTFASVQCSESIATYVSLSVTIRVLQGFHLMSQQPCGVIESTALYEDCKAHVY